jgi:hypothetical protein
MTAIGRSLRSCAITYCAWTTRSRARRAGRNSRFRHCTRCSSSIRSKGCRRTSRIWTMCRLLPRRARLARAPSLPKRKRSRCPHDSRDRPRGGEARTRCQGCQRCEAARLPNVRNKPRSHLALVLAIAIAESVEQRTFFPRYCQNQIARAHHSHHQSAHGHQR